MLGNKIRVSSLIVLHSPSYNQHSLFSFRADCIACVNMGLLELWKDFFTNFSLGCGNWSILVQSYYFWTYFCSIITSLYLRVSKNGSFICSVVTRSGACRQFQLGELCPVKSIAMKWRYLRVVSVCVCMAKK